MATTSDARKRREEQEQEQATTDCDHVEGGEIAGYERNEWLRFTFCPKCGEKL